jgi:hypothetical protein
MRPSRHISVRTRPSGKAILWLTLSAVTLCSIGCTGTVKPNSNVTTQTPPGTPPTTPTGQTFAISGTVSPAPSATTTISLSGTASATTTAASNGTYSFSGLAAGTYAVTPSASGFGFNPTTQAAVITTTDITNLNFVSAAQTSPTFSLSGTISPSSAGSGAAVVLTGPVGATATANSSGAYSFPGLANGTYSVTPSKPGFTFTPGTQTATVNSANLTGVNFTGVASTQAAHSVSLKWDASTSTVTGYNIYRSTTSGSGYVKLNGSPLTNLTYTDGSVSSGSTYFYVATAVDSGGDESPNSNQATAVVP